MQAATPDDNRDEEAVATAGAGKKQEEVIGIGADTDEQGKSEVFALEVEDDDGAGGGALRFGFAPENRTQLFCHWVLAVLIGTSLRMTTFPDAIIAAGVGGGGGSAGRRYSRETSFLVSFGFTKAASNLVVGWASDRPGPGGGRRAPHAAGWVAGLALGSLLLFAATTATNDDGGADGRGWTLYVIANVFLGAQQGLTWTTNIFMFMDILGPDHRALASAVSNCTGYITSAVATFVSAAISARSSFAVVLGSSALGLAITGLIVEDTTGFVKKEAELVLSSVKCGDNAVDDDDCGEKAAAVTAARREGSDASGRARRSTDNITVNKKRRLRPSGSGSATSGTRQSYDLLAPSSSVDGGSALAASPGSPVLVWSPPTSSFRAVFVTTCWRNRSTAVVCLGGLMANLVTSFAWGLTLIWGKQQGLSATRLGNIGFAFTLSKALSMVVSGHASDRRRDRKRFLLAGFAVAVLGLLLTAAAGFDATSVGTSTGGGDDGDVGDGDVGDGNGDGDGDIGIFLPLLLGGIVIGCGIGSVYCIMTGAVSDHTPPRARASAIGVYKLWRDSGYAFGGLLTGYVADLSGGSFATTTAVVASLVIALLVSIFACYAEPGAAAGPSLPSRRDENARPPRPESNCRLNPMT